MRFRTWPADNSGRIGGKARCQLSVTTYVDESKVGGFTLAAASIACRDVARLREVVDSLRLPGQARLHFVTESDPRRKHIVASLADAGGISAVLYDARGVGGMKEGPRHRGGADGSRPGRDPRVEDRD